MMWIAENEYDWILKDHRKFLFLDIEFQPVICYGFIWERDGKDFHESFALFTGKDGKLCGPRVIYDPSNQKMYRIDEDSYITPCRVGTVKYDLRNIQPMTGPVGKIIPFRPKYVM